MNESITEAKVIAGFLARANPPSLLYRYRGTSTYTLSEISKHEIYAVTPDELNDPFEHSAPVFWNVELMKRDWLEKFAPAQGFSAEQALKEFELHSDSGIQTLIEGLKRRRSQSGIVCFSGRPDSIRMWSYYAKSHEGICLGYDTKFRPFNIAMRVNYQNPNKPFDVVACLQHDPTEIANHITLRKAEEWKFEDEYRIPVNIGENSRLIPFHPSAIKEIRFGARMKTDFREKIMEAISHLPQTPRLIQMGCDFDRFVLTESVV